MTISELGAMIHVDRERAKARVLEAFVEAKGDRRDVAKALGCTYRNFYRFVERLKLWGEIDRLTVLHGFSTVFGPPRAVDRVQGAVIEAKGDLAKAARKLGIPKSALVRRIREFDIFHDLNRVIEAAGGTPLGAEFE